MIKSKDIADYIELKTKDIVPDQPIPGDLYLYFKANSHVLLWKPKGTSFPEDILKKLVERGIGSVWVHKEEWEDFYRFLHPVEEEPEPKKFAQPPQFTIIDYRKLKKPVEAQELIYNTKVTPQYLVDIVADERADDREKQAKLAKSSRALLAELANAKIDAQGKINKGISRTLQEFLKKVQTDAEDFTAEIWEVTEINSESSHSVNVATFSVLFAMALGKSNEKELLEIATAALLHDVGMAQIPYRIVQTPSSKMSTGQEAAYLKHATFAGEFISTYAPHLSKRIMTMISSHHNDFSKTDRADTALEMGQLIGLADELDSRCNGLFDGKNRSVHEALLSMREESGSNFNQRVSTAILRWVDSNMSFDPDKDQAA